MIRKLQQTACASLLGVAVCTSPAAAQLLSGGGGDLSATGMAKPDQLDPGAPTAPYDKLDSVEGDRVMIMNPPVNPMVLDENTLRMWAIDNHNNEVHLFDNTTGIPSATWGVPSGPVSLALWNDTSVDGGERLLVVCRSSWVVCMLDAVTGQILGVLQMEDPVNGEVLGEPSDILIDSATNQAFVSCSTADAVAEIDLSSWSISNVYRIPSKNPVFLAFDTNGDVLVAPELSGNNSIVHRGEFPTVPVFNDQAQELGIMDLDDPALAVSGLNDYDMFRVIRSGAAIGSVQPVVSSAGTVLFAHGVNPVTGDCWMLNTEANNKDAALQSEALVNGNFASNRLSLVQLQSGQVVEPYKIIDLDVFGVDVMGDPIYDADRSMAQPFNLVCTDTGFTFVVGMLSDNVSLYDPQGNFVLEWDLPAGAIPRDVIYSPSLNTVFVYCWGINQVLGYVFTNPVQPPWISLDLGKDPLPDDLKRGREILFSSAFSENKRFSCLTCHIDGHSDLVAWNLSGAKDDKGPLMTQTLTGLETVHPFHWRGEQEGQGDQLMGDFNDAFVNLLGSPNKLDQTPGGQWDNFEDFVFTLQHPANPGQHERRIIDRDHEPPLLPGSPVANSVQGLEDFRAGCLNCHTFPKGTANDFTADGAVFGDLNAHRIDFKVAPFQAHWRRNQDANPLLAGIQFETVDFVDSIPNLGDTDFFPPLGIAFSHAGLFAALQHFVFLFQFSFETASNLTGFINQWDSGVGPLSYRAWYVDDLATAATLDDINNYLVPECTTPKLTGTGQSILNGDFAVIGTFLWQGTEIPMRWYYDPSLQLLVPEDSSIPPQSVATILAQAAAGQSTNTFIGMPVGTSRRFAVDKDGDDLFNGDELNQPGGGSDVEVVDSDGDGFWDGHEVLNGSIPTDAQSIPNDVTRPTFVNDQVTVLWETARTAVVLFETSEQTTAVIRYKSTTGDVGKAVSPHFARRHRIVLANLDPSNDFMNLSTYTGFVIITDHAGLKNSPRQFLPSFSTKTFLGDTERVKTGGISFSMVPTSPTSTMTVRVRAVQRRNSFAPIGMAGYQVIANVCLDDGTPVALDTMGTPQTFTVEGVVYDALPGPFVLSTGLTDASGFADLTFSVPSALTGQTLTLAVHGIQRPSLTWTSAAPDFDNMADWSFPDTPKALRTISTNL